MASGSYTGAVLCVSSVKKPLAIALELGYTIAIPIVVFALAGQALDQFIKTSPLFLFVGIALAITSTTIWLTKKAKSMLREIEQASEKSSDLLKEIRPPRAP